MLSPRAQQALSTVPAFRGLGEDERKQVAGLVREVLLEKGRVVYRAGDAADALYLVASGAVDVLDGKKTIVRRTSDARTVIDSHQLKQVRLEFLRNIDRRNLASGWADSLRRIGGTEMEPSIARFTSLISDVRRGDTMSFTWRPGTGIEVTLGGEVRGSVPGDQFARTLFELWFGSSPGDERLKGGMLGK